MIGQIAAVGGASHQGSLEETWSRDSAGQSQRSKEPIGSSAALERERDLSIKCRFKKKNICYGKMFVIKYFVFIY